MANKEKYKIANEEVNKAVPLAKNKAYENLYQRLETMDGEKDAFKLARARERKTRDLGEVRCSEGEE